MAAYCSFSDFRYQHDNRVSCAPSTSACGRPGKLVVVCQARLVNTSSRRRHTNHISSKPVYSGTSTSSAPSRESCTTSDVDVHNSRATLERLYRISEQVLDLWDGNSLPTEALSLPTRYAVTTDEKPKAKSNERSPDFYANLGDVIRTLREDIPELFERELNCK